MPNTKRQHANLQDLFAYCIRTENGCIEWQKNRDKNGYGRYRIQGEKLRLNRWVATLIYGEPNLNEQALHSCDNPPCINPDHLRWGTAKENVEDRSNRNRHRPNPRRGVAHPRAKLDELSVYDIRLLASQNIPITEIAKKYGVGKNAVRKVITRTTWKHI